MKIFLLCSIVALLGHFQMVTYAQKIILIAPSVLQVGEEHKVVVSAYGFGGQTAPVQVRVELPRGMPLHLSPITSVPDGGTVETTVVVLERKIAIFKPPPSYVFVKAEIDTPTLSFVQRKRVVLSRKSLSVFIQTDKPIYTRDDSVYLRIVVVNSQLIPKNLAKVVIEIKNNDTIVVDRFDLETTSNIIIRRHEIDLGPRPSLGQWTITAKYGIHSNETSHFHFEVQDYILPRFVISIIPPNYVTPAQQNIDFAVTAMYTYGKGVVGTVATKLGAWDDDTGEVTVFHNEVFRLSPHEGGTKRISTPNRGYGLYPLGQKLWVYAAVTEQATGKKFNTTDLSVKFTTSPYTLQCETTKPYYKPGLPVTGSIKILYLSGKPAENIKLTVRDVAGNVHDRSTDKDGIVVFSFPTIPNENDFKVSVRIAGEQILSHCSYKPFEKPCNENSTHIYIRSATPGKLRSCTAYPVSPIIDQAMGLGHSTPTFLRGLKCL
ncbi:complement C3-like [Corticium candelabrum]|uniref:complement C3-like n=1 Tax=Corticium candelabrum TaxID=121492 RepID=UPI002E260A03|nr:complement C3-like [Corticium candelabrum]